MDDYHGTFARFHSYGIGILAGWIIKESRRVKFAFSKRQILICCVLWLTALSLLFMSYFGAQIWHKPVLNGDKFDFSDVVLNSRAKGNVSNSTWF